MTSTETVFVGIKIQPDTLDIAIAPKIDTENDQNYATISPDLLSFANIVQELNQKYADLHFVHEAGSCGYKYFHYLSSQRLVCSIIAPIPKGRNPAVSGTSGYRDALQLARLQRAGNLTKICVPHPEDAAMRDLVRCCEVARLYRSHARSQVQNFLKRNDIQPDEGWNWSAEQWQWLERVTFHRDTQDIVFREYLNMVLVAGLTLKRLEKQMVSSVKNWRMQPLVDAYQALRGVNLLTAVTMAAMLGDPRRFDSPRKLMRYTGSFPDKNFNKVKFAVGQQHDNERFGLLITVLFEAAWAYSRPKDSASAVLPVLTGLPKPVVAIARKAELNLCLRYQNITSKGESHEYALAEIARELLRYAWKIALEVSVN